MLLFSFAGNILPAYILPGLPAFALLLAKPLAARNSPLVHAAWLIPIMFPMLGEYVVYSRLADRSQHDLVSYVQETAKVEQLIYLFDRPYSASFYSAGKAAFAASPDDARSFLDKPGRDYLAVRASRLDDLPLALTEQLDVVRPYSRYVLMIESDSDID